METKQNQKAIIYCRVSTKEQAEEGYSLEAQEKLLNDYAVKYDLKGVETYKIAETASKDKLRKLFREVFIDATKNNVNIILCEKIDRLTRNPKDAATVDDWVKEKQGRAVHFVKENFVLNQQTRAHENLVWDMKVAIARFYSNNLSEEVKKGQAEKIAQGWLPTTSPLGYKTVGDKGHKIHVIDETRSPFIKKMFQLYATGNYSILALGKKMYDLGFRSRTGGRVVKSKIHTLLSEPFYYGKFLWKGQIYQGSHEPLISKDLFDQVQSKLKRPNSPHFNRHSKELRGKILCGNCNKTVTWEIQKGHWYGACKQCKAQLSLNKKYIHQEDVEKALMKKITSIAPKNERVLFVLNKALKESHNEEIMYHETQVNAINASLVRIQQRIRNMYEDYLDRRITQEIHDQKLKDFKTEEETLTESLRKLKSDNTEYYRVGSAIHELALRADKIYQSNNATVEERRLLLSYAFDSISVLNGVVTPKYTEAFNFLAHWMPKANEVLEPRQKEVKSNILSDKFPISIPVSAIQSKEVILNSRTTKNSTVTNQSTIFDTTYRPVLPG